MGLGHLPVRVEREIPGQESRHEPEDAGEHEPLTGVTIDEAVPREDPQRLQLRSGGLAREGTNGYSARMISLAPAVPSRLRARQTLSIAAARSVTAIRSRRLTKKISGPPTGGSAGSTC